MSGKIDILNDFLNKWYYVENPNGGYIYIKYSMKMIDGKELLTQVILSGNKMMDGVYVITEYSLKKKDFFQIKLKNYDVFILGDSKELLKQQLINNNYLSLEEFEKFYNKNDFLIEGVEKLIFKQ